MQHVYDDVVYGTFSITEDVLGALLVTPTVRRLEGVRQHGITAVIGVTSNVTRYEHSVGTMLLVRRLGGGVTEQIAALLHDVSHTAFSHVIDHVLDTAERQSYHDQIQARFVAESELPALLAAHGYDWEEVVDESLYPLLEQPAPALCADRVDYCLRDALSAGLINRAEVADFLAHLVVVEGRMVVDDVGVARWMGETYMKMDEGSWSNFWEVGLYEVTARALRVCLAEGVLGLADFEETDDVVWGRMRAAEQAEVRRWIDLIKPETRFVWDETRPDFWVETKIRVLDPEVLVGGEVKRLSVVDPAYGYRMRLYRERKGRPWPMRVVAGE